MPENERAICHRLKKARAVLKMTRSEVASRIGVTQEALAAWEAGRAPLRHAVAVRFCSEFCVDLTWLATGAGSHAATCDNPGIAYHLPPRLRFSAAWEQHYRQAVIAAGKQKPALNPRAVEKSRQLLRAQTEYWLETVPNENFKDFVDFMVHSAAHFIRKTTDPSKTSWALIDEIETVKVHFPPDPPHPSQNK